VGFDGLAGDAVREEETVLKKVTKMRGKPAGSGGSDGYLRKGKREQPSYVRDGN